MSERVVLYVEVDPELKAEVDAAVDKLSGSPEYLTRRALVERAVAAQLEELRKKHNRGRKFAA